MSKMIPTVRCAKHSKVGPNPLQFCYGCLRATINGNHTKKLRKLFPIIMKED